MILWFPVITAFICFGISRFRYRWLLRQKDLEGDALLLPQAIKEASFFNYRQLARKLLILSGILAIALALAFWHWMAGVACFCGSLMGVAGGLTGIFVGTQANSRTCAAVVQEQKDKEAFSIAYFSGGILGPVAMSLSLLGMTIFYAISKNDPRFILTLTCFSFGFSLYALLACVGGGIFTKTADIGTDLVGKIEEGIDEDSEQNPGLVADNTGDLFSDLARVLADTGDSEAGSILSLITLTVSYLALIYHSLALVMVSFGVWATLLGVYLPMVFRKKLSNKGVLNLSYLTTAVAFLSFYFLYVQLQGLSLGVFMPAIAGTAVVVILGFGNQFFTGNESQSVEMVAKAAEKGAGFVVLAGLVVGFESLLLPTLSVGGALLASYYSAQWYGMAGIIGIASASLSMLCMSGIIIATDGFGPICDNAASFARKFGKEVRRACDELDAIGNTTKNLTKLLTVCSATLTIFALLLAYCETAGISVTEINLGRPEVVVALTMGILLPFIFSGILVKAVLINAELLVDNIRLQFKEIREGTRKKPDYLVCIQVVADAAFDALKKPTICSVCGSVVIGLALGKYALGGFIMGIIPASGLLAMFCASAGAALDNGKKWWELLGKSGTYEHKAAVAGDLVGDPLKDTIAVALETLAALATLVAILLASLLKARGIW